MARKFIELQQVAALLGVSPDDLGDMRSRGEIYGYRDGSTWKFKIEEVQRLASDRGITLSEAALAGEVPLAGDSVFLSAVDEELDVLSEVDGDYIDPGESVLVTDEDFGALAEIKAIRTVIGGKNTPKEADADAGTTGSDPKHTGDPSDSGSDLQVVDDAAPGSDVKLLGEGSHVLSGGSADPPQDAPSGDSKDAGSRIEGMSDELSLEMTSGGDLAAGESLSLGESDLQLADNSSAVSGGGSSESASIDLDFEDDDDMVLGGSNVTLTRGDSGISLSSPSDTGLLLTDQPFDLGGSAAESSLELPEEIVPLKDAVAGVAEDDFLLTPIEESPGEESDSGSQVIALDTDDSYDEDAAPLLGSEAKGGVAGGPGVAVRPTISALAVSAEPPYTLLNVSTLAATVIVLSFTGFCIYDVVRHMWSWDEPYSINSSLMEWILGMLVG